MQKSKSSLLIIAVLRLLLKCSINEHLVDTTLRESVQLLLLQQLLLLITSSTILLYYLHWDPTYLHLLKWYLIQTLSSNLVAYLCVLPIGKDLDDSLKTVLCLQLLVLLVLSIDLSELSLQKLLLGDLRGVILLLLLLRH